jgi:hypothetical protein
MKGEEQLTLRLMDDITLPASPTSHELTPGWHRFGEPTSSIGPDLNRVPAGKASSTPAEVAGTEALIAPTGNLGTAPRLTLIATKSGATYPVTKYRIDHDRLSYISRDGIERSIGATEVDWKTTSQLNAERSSAVQSRPAQSPTKLELATVN